MCGALFRVVNDGDDSCAQSSMSRIQFQAFFLKEDITKTDYNTNKEVPLPKQRNLSHAPEEDFDKYGPDSSGKR